MPSGTLEVDLSFPEYLQTKQSARTEDDLLQRHIDEYLAENALDQFGVWTKDAQVRELNDLFSFFTDDDLEIAHPDLSS